MDARVKPGHDEGGRAWSSRRVGAKRAYLPLLRWGQWFARARGEAVELGKQQRPDRKLRQKDAPANQPHELGGGDELHADARLGFEAVRAFARRHEEIVDAVVQASRAGG